MTDTRSALQIRRDVIALVSDGLETLKPKMAEITEGIAGIIAERDRLKALNADLLTALRNMTALANNMRETIEGGNFVTRYEIPFGYFNAAYVAMEKAES